MLRTGRASRVRAGRDLAGRAGPPGWADRDDPEALKIFADSLAPTDEVALEATGNTHAIVRLLQGRVARVVVSNPQKTRAMPRPRSRPTRSTPRSSRSCWRPTTCRRCGWPTRTP